MPANLPPEYFEAEKLFKEAVDPRGKIAALETLIATVPKHKGTDKLRADLRRRLSKLREGAVRRKKGGKSDMYSVPKEGAAQVTLAGFANSGKSALVKALTNARTVVAAYPISTVLPLAGMMPYEDIQFQMVDLPPVGNAATDGWLSAVLRNSDLILLVVDLSEDPEARAELLIGELSKWGVLSGKKAILVGTKLDACGGSPPLEALKSKHGIKVVSVSSKTKEGLEDLRRAIFETSGIIRVYSKEPGKEPDMNVPFTVPKGATVLGLATLIHKDFKNLKYACIWGSARFPGQRVQKDHVLKDMDVVEFHV